MINHVSIGVNDPERVANVIAEIWNGYVFPFPPSPNSFLAVAGDEKGTAIEVTPINTVLVPGEGFPAEFGFNESTPTGEFEAKFVSTDFSPRFSATHVAMNTRLDESEVKEIARREGWRTITANRGEGLFQLIEIWVENNLMLEVFTPEMTRRYIEIMKPEFIAASMDIPLAAAVHQQPSRFEARV
ncbi:MAG: hypothetical protein KDB79_00935 [Acidobacteria bacterium]|nr:hypothetical protein [Acidobacteriota bacterium]